MAREIRVTVDDDEVFERMRARKRELDLSWEEVLHRGLTDTPGADRDFDERVEQHVQNRIRESLANALGMDDGDNEPTGRRATGGGGGGSTPREGASSSTPGGYNPESSGGVDPAGTAQPGGATGGGAPAPAPPTGLDEEVARLEAAEDAQLEFPFLADDPGNTVPLRVDLETGVDGLDVSVVAIRTGRDVADRNQFERGARQAIAEAFVGGETARLTLGDGAETYPVVPELAWRTADGRPTVTAVSIPEVRVGDTE